MTRMIAPSAFALLCAISPVQAQDLKVGFLATLSGQAAALGQDMVDGFKLGIRGAEQKIKVVYEDDQFRPDTGLQAVQKLLESEKVNVVAGIPWSNILLATAKPVLDSGAVMMSSNAGPSELAGRQCNPNFFSVSFQNDTPHEAMGKYAADEGFKRVYLMAPNYPAGKDAMAGFKRFYKDAPAGEVYTPLNQLDYAAEIAQLRAAKPDALYFFYAGAMGAAFLKQFKQAGLDQEIKLLGPIFSLDNIIVTATGDLAKGAKVSTFWSETMDNPVNKAFVADFKAAYRRAPTSYAATSFDLGLMLKGAVEKLGPKASDSKALSAELRKAEFASVRGAFRFNTNQFPVQDFYVGELIPGADGRLVISNQKKVLTSHADAYVGTCKM